MIESQFDELLVAVERVKREVMEILEGEERQALKQAEGIRAHLEQRCMELKKTQAQVEKLSKHKNDVDFLQVTALRFNGALPQVKIKDALSMSRRNIQSGRKRPPTFRCRGSTSV